MTVIEQLVESLNNSRPHKENFSGFDEFYAACDKHDEAIAAGEAELRREPVAWRSWYIDSNNYVIWQQKPSSTTFMLEPLYTRDETKMTQRKWLAECHAWLDDPTSVQFQNVEGTWFSSCRPTVSQATQATSRQPEGWLSLHKRTA